MSGHNIDTELGMKVSNMIEKFNKIEQMFALTRFDLVETEIKRLKNIQDDIKDLQSQIKNMAFKKELTVFEAKVQSEFVPYKNFYLQSKELSDCVRKCDFERVTENVSKNQQKIKEIQEQ